jgi:hypothetical protein
MGFASNKRAAMRTSSNFAMKWLAVALSFLIAFPILEAQTIPTQLTITVVEGEGAISHVRQRVAREPVVRIEDENHKPVAGAVVVFTLPTDGASGDFGNGSKTLTVNTDSQGQAVAQGLKMNQAAGKVPIHINASYRGLTARTSIMQFSVLPPGAKESTGGGHGALIGVLVALGAAAAGGGAYFATHQNNKSTTSTTPPAPTLIGITAGSGSITGGH